MNSSSANKRIAKNTLLLYGRMILLLVISLYTSRVILAALGFDDYGIYNVVGGVVTIFTFINMAMSNATSRFITFSLGKNIKEESIKVFNSAIIIHVIISVFIILLAETVGLWFVHNKMVIPASRMNAALWVYQFSVISCVCTIICVPFNSTIIAHEKMGAFAYISILDAILKLTIAYIINVATIDRLILYAFLYLCVNLINIIIYQIYCVKKFDTVKFKVVKDYALIKEMTSFAGWSLIGNLAYVGYTQGVNILLNIFFGPVINAARAIAVQVQGTIKGFITNFQMSINPQITKSYAEDNIQRVHSLIFASSKLSYFLLLCIVLPVCIESKFLLHLWLGNVPDYTVQFVILTLITMLIDPLANPIGIANDACGNIRNYQIIQGGFLLLILPLGYLTIKHGGSPISVFVIQLIITFLGHILRLMLVCSRIQMSIRMYYKKIITRIILTTALSLFIPLLIYYTTETTIISVIIVMLTSIVSVLLTSYFVGLNRNEQIIINNKLKIIISKLSNIFKH